MFVEKISHGTATVKIGPEDAALLAIALREAGNHLYTTEGTVNKQVATAALGACFAALAIALEATNWMQLSTVDELAASLHSLGLDVVATRPIGKLAVLDVA